MQLKRLILLPILCVVACAGDGSSASESEELLPSETGSGLLSIREALPSGEITFEETGDGSLLISVSGNAQAQKFLSEHSSDTAVGLYRAAAARPNAAIEAKLAAAEARAEAQNALLRAAPAPAELPAERSHNKDWNPNGCNPASTQWTQWFHNTKCTNGADFGWGWIIDRWPGVCSDLTRTYGPGIADAWFAVNYDGNGVNTCSWSRIVGEYWTGQTWNTLVDYDIPKGQWRAWRSTRPQQKWRVDGPSGQCRQGEVFACHLRK